MIQKATPAQWKRSECPEYINPDTDGRPFTLFPVSVFLPAVCLVTRGMEHPDR